MEQDNLYGQPKEAKQGPWFSAGEGLDLAVEPIPVEVSAAAFESPEVTAGPAIDIATSNQESTAVHADVTVPEREDARSVVPSQQTFSAAQFAAQQIPVFHVPAAQTADVPTAPTVNGEEPARSERKGGKTLLRILAAVFALAFVAVGTAGLTAALMDSRFQHQLKEMEERIEELDAEQKVDGPNYSNSPNINVGSKLPEGEFLTPAQVYQMNLNSVVMIYNEIKGNRFTADAVYTGTGFVISENGYVVTNFHVVEGDGELRVVTPSGEEYEAKLIGSNNANDVALLKVDGTNMQAVTLGDSDALIVGDQVVAIGNPLGELTSTLTVGYISAKERDVNTSGFAINMLQTDAAINSGNSGGPLFNMRGEVVGITTAKYSGASGSGATIEGIGFAIPINDVWDLIEDLMENGRETGPYLGVSVSDMNVEYALEHGIPIGVYVNEVVEDSCCHKAGLQAEDIILELDGREVKSVNELSRVLRSLEPGDQVEMKILRGEEEEILQVTLDEKPLEE